MYWFESQPPPQITGKILGTLGFKSNIKQGRDGKTSNRT